MKRATTRPLHALFPAAWVSPPSPLAWAVRVLWVGGMLVGGGSRPVWAELPVPSDHWVGAGQASHEVNGGAMVIRQQSDKAILDWKSFNIGVGNTVEFKQPAATSVALNRIHQSDPSRIFGTLTANGQVYLVNQNGFVFGKDSQVNVNSLVASTLNISEQTFQLGLARAFSQNNQPALSATDAAGQSVKQLYLQDPQGQPVLDQNGQKVKVQIFIEAGAKIGTQAANGRIILAAPSITNAGNITAPDGQVILAAAQDKVYLQQANADADIRGLLVEVGTGGDVNNVGKIIAERGNASLIGFAVNQKGMVSATTSVKLNGSVRLLAREGFQVNADGALLPGSTRRATALDDGLGRRAKVTLAKDSLTSVELDAHKAETAVDAQTQGRSKIEIQGNRITAREGATVRAKSGRVTLSAADDPVNPLVQGEARIYLARGSRIDVSGVKNVVLPMSRNVLKVELRGNELRDSPLQRDGVLHGKTVSVDLRDVDSKGRIPIADVSGALARIERAIDERSTEGGSIHLTSSGDVITRPGSVLDVSGGSVRYRAGVIKTTQLVSGQQLFDIGKADPDRHYDGILGDIIKLHPKWGITQTWARYGVGLKRFEPGYVEGKAGGSLHIAAFNAMLDGLMNGQTVNGKFQRQPDTRTPGSTLVIDLNQGGLQGHQDVRFSRNTTPGALGEDDSFPSQTTGDDSLAEALRLGTQALRRSGFSQLHLKTNGKVDIAADARLRLPVYGRVDMAAAGFNVQGRINVAGGTVSLAPMAVDVDGKPFPEVSGITLGPDARISVAGTWVNDRANPVRTHTPAAVAVDGGTVRLVTEQDDLRLAPGSRIEASGGAWLPGNNHLTSGQGGTIQLIAQTQVLGRSPSNLILGGRLEAWGSHEGGRLEVASSQVLIGPGPVIPKPDHPEGLPLALTPGFFRRGGFADYHITANHDGLTVADGVTLQLRQQNKVLTADAHTAPSGGRPPSRIVTLPEAVRQPVNLHLAVAQTTEQNRAALLSIGQGADIRVERGGAVGLSADTSVRVEGHITAPAGNIAIDIVKPSAGDRGFFASQSIWLGSESLLSARGVFAPEPNDLGLVTGEVLPGGTVSLTARRGYIVSQPGARIDVSGTAAELQFRDQATATGITPRTIASKGGTIALTAGEGLVLAGEFAAQGGSAKASGGELRVELNGTLRGKPSDFILGGIFPDDRNPDAPRSLTISAANTSPLPADLGFGSDLPTQDFAGRGWIAADQIAAGGFGRLSVRTDAVNLNNDYVGSIRFQGDVRLSAGREIRLDSPSLAWEALSAQDRGDVSLVAPLVTLGSTRSRVDNLSGSTLLGSTLAPEPVPGPARFTASGQGIDLVGGLSFNGFGLATFNSQGDIRAIGIRQATETKNYLGELKLAGDVRMLASQVYPTTLTDYRFTLTGTDSRLSIDATGQTRAPIYSAGGSLSLNAAHIVQAGVVAAPFGQLEFNAAKRLQLSSGSLTTVSGNDLIVPFGRGSGGLNWLYPLDSAGLINRVIDTPPEKRVALNGPTIRLQPEATVDLSGGGDLRAYEFITGPGGSNDVLNVGADTRFAVIPGVNSLSTPYDPMAFPNSGLRVGDSIHLSHGSGLPAGNYTLLPAHYALLPGAYLVTPQAGTRDLTPGDSYTLLNGATVVAGRYQVAGTALADDRWQGFAVEAGRIARTRSEYRDYAANTFFTDKAQTADTAIPQRPMDAGGLVLAAGTALSLGADVYAAAAPGGRGGRVDISADQLAIVGRRADLATRNDPGTVSLVAEDLNRLGVESLLLGGLRSQDSKGQRLTVTAKQITIAGNADLAGRDIVLAAQNEVRLDAGAVVESTGAVGGAADDLYLVNRGAADTSASSDGALLRVSSLDQVNVVRAGTVTGQTGILTVESGARLKSDGAILVDATQDTRFEGGFVMHGGALSLTSSKISLGEAPAGTSGLVLPGNQISQLALDELRLSSATDIALYGSASLAAGALFLDAAALNGYGQTGETATITADSLRWTHTGATTSVLGTGHGQLSLKARQVGLGSGNYAINGFERIDIQATESLDAQAHSTGQLKVAGDVNLSTGRIIGGDGATLGVDAVGHTLTLSSLSLPAAATNAAGLGASWSFRADSIAGNARFELPSGALRLEAIRGDVDIQAGSVLDVSGQTTTLGTLRRYSPAGRVALVAEQGHVTLASGASVNLNGADTQSAAGSLTVHAAGSFQWAGDVTARAATGAQPGRFSLDAGTFGDFTALNRKLGAAGFTDRLSLRQRTGDLVLFGGETLRAHQVELALDQGSVRIDGTIDASGQDGGRVTIQASRGITLTSSALIDAHATGAGEAGGHVTLDTVVADSEASGSGLLNLSEAARIEVAGGRDGAGGSVHLRTGRDDATGHVNATAIHATITGSSRTVLEATRVYNDVATIDAAAIASYQADTAAFMAKATQAWGLPRDVLLAPGIDIRNTGDIALNSPWDFMATATDANSGVKTALWRYDGVPGYLTLNAGGDLKINATLTDAFATTPLPDPLGLSGSASGVLFQDTLQPGYSWSYQLKAGGDVLLAPHYLGADPLDPGQTISRQVMVRTGTGSIDIEAGHDIRFVADANDSQAAAAVYTLGRPADYTWSDLLLGHIPGVPKPGADQNLADYLRGLDPKLLAGLLRSGYFNEYHQAWNFLAEYPSQGGRIDLQAGHDIHGIQTGQRVSDWLVRSGTWNDDPADISKTPTAWGINISGGPAHWVVSGVDAEGNPILVNAKNDPEQPQDSTQQSGFFNQNVGALGGGTVSVWAGGDVADLSVMIPTTGKPLGIQTTASGQPNLGTEAGLDVRWLENRTVVQGGGDLAVAAGGDIRGGEFYTGRGTATLDAGGGIYAGEAGLATVVELGETRVDLQARTDVQFGTALNPTLLPQRVIPDFASGKTADFITYSADSAVNLSAVGGNIQLQDGIDAWKTLKNYSLDEEAAFNLALYPGTLRATAFKGDIAINGSINLFPSAQGQLELVAGGSLGTQNLTASNLSVNLSDADPSLLPSVAYPVTQLIGNAQSPVLMNQYLDAGNPSSSVTHATTPVHSGDSTRVAIIAGTGDIAVPTGGRIKFFLPKAADIEAGRDIRNISFYLQNLSAGNITRLQAGRDIAFDTDLDSNGNVNSLDQRIQMSGPGALQVVAGRDINLGSSAGILGVGNLANRALPSDGAAIDVVAGLSDKLDYDRFLAAYLAPGSVTLKNLDMPGVPGFKDLSDQEKLALIAQAADSTKLGIAQHVLFSVIKHAAAKAAAAPENQRKAFYDQGFKAIATLFPGKDYAGDLALVFSQIKTFAGGDIRISVPGGQVDVGLAGKVGGIQKSADQLGIVVQGAGELDAFTRDDFNVNQSRVSTLGGGDITIWSSKGDIDAGKGAKSAISAPPPITTLDEKGNFVTVFPPIVSGSGIQAVTPADASLGQGNVYLAAPAGVVNAGDAGISGGKVVIAANAVVGAANIQASGGTVGVPTAVAPPVVPGGVAGAAAGAAKAATASGGLDDAGGSQTKNDEAATKQAISSLLNTDVVGYGECSVMDVRNGKPGCGG